MKNLTIEQLNEIVSSMDLEQIKAELEQHGYRNAGKHGKLEFDLMKIINKERTTATDDYEDIFDDHSYWAEVYEDVEDFGGYDFIIVIQLNTKLDMPSQIYMYTTAPINEAYEKEQEEVKKCKRCGKKFKTYALWEADGKYYCPTCFQKEFSKKARKK